MSADFHERAKRLRQGVVPLEIQVEAAEMLSKTGRLIVTLPTGAGKTLLAAMPFAAGLLRPKQMIFMTPLRTLTEAQSTALARGIDPISASTYLGVPWSVRAQTGTAPEDPLFTAPAVVCTFDQALSSALSIAFSTSRRRREVNAASVLSAYLVCDEIHLFPRDEALTTLLWLLKHRPELPFTLMTATLSRPVVAGLADLLNAQVVDSLPEQDAATLNFRERMRVVRWQDWPFEPEDIIAGATESPDGRAIVVVNTVSRAQELGAALGALLGQDRVLILHSRFYPNDRLRIEASLHRWMGRNGDLASGPHILVATQVIEAGLDISAAFLFSEWAPANALVQRWGRCARWGGAGYVTIAPPPGLAEALPAPYARGGTSRSVLEQTRDWLREHAGSGIVMSDEAESALLDAAHAADDEQWIDGLSARLRRQSTAIGESIEDGLYSHAGGLIRRVDNRTILIHGAPETLADPLHASGFSLATGTLFGLLARSQQALAAEDADEDDFISFDLPEVSWTLKRPVWDESSERRAGTPGAWVSAEPNDLRREALFALNPALVSYDPQLGLRLAQGPTPEEFWSEPAARSQRTRFAFYRRETYAAHIERMLAVLAAESCLWPTFDAVAAVVENWCVWPSGTLNRLVRAAIALHDAGKLTDRWQAAIRRYQQEGGNPYEPWLVHSDERPGARLDAGPHALAGAACSLGVGQALDREVTTWRAMTAVGFGDEDILPSRVLFTAIARHHGAGLNSTVLTSAERLSTRAVAYLAQILRAQGLPSDIVEPPVGVPLDAFQVVNRDMNQVGQDAEYLALVTVSRLLRLADGWSQESKETAARHAAGELEGS